MSVLKSKRKTSRLEFLHNAYAIQRSFTLLLLRDFGTKPKIRATRFFAVVNKMSEEDKTAFLDLTDKYGISSIVDEYPEWLISDMRNRVLQEIRFLVRNIIQANSIYPAYIQEYIDRRRYQTMAIGNCEQLLQEMQYVISIIDVDVNKYLPYVDMIEKEIALLRAWRKSDNRLLEHVKRNEAKRLAIEPNKDKDKEGCDELDKKTGNDSHNATTKSRKKNPEDDVGIESAAFEAVSRISTYPPNNQSDAVMKSMKEAVTPDGATIV